MENMYVDFHFSFHLMWNVRERTNNLNSYFSAVFLDTFSWPLICVLNLWYLLHFHMLWKSVIDRCLSHGSVMYTLAAVCWLIALHAACIWVYDIKLLSQIYMIAAHEEMLPFTYCTTRFFCSWGSVYLMCAVCVKSKSIPCWCYIGKPSCYSGGQTECSQLWAVCWYHSCGGPSLQWTLVCS